MGHAAPESEKKSAAAPADRWVGQSVLAKNPDAKLRERPDLAAKEIAWSPGTLRCEVKAVDADWLRFSHGWLLARDAIRQADAMDYFNGVIDQRATDFAYVSRALLYVLEARAERAIADCNAAISLNPASSGAYYNRALAQTIKWRSDLAFEDFNVAIRLKPDEPTAYRCRGDIFQRREQFADAAENYRRAIERGLREPALYLQSGSMKSKLGDFDGAIDDYTQSIRLDPTQAEAYMRRGFALMSKNEFPKAIDDCNLAIERDPRDYLSHCNRAVCRAVLGDPSKALDDLTRAILLHPEYSQAYGNRGALLLELKRYTEARADLDTQISINPTPLAFSNRGSLRLMMGDYAGALTDFEIALRQNPRQESALVGQATIWSRCPLEQLRDVPRAIQSAERACQLAAWADPQAIFALAAAKAELGDFKQALELVQRVPELLRKPDTRFRDDSLQKTVTEMTNAFRENKPYRRLEVSSQDEERTHDDGR